MVEAFALLSILKLLMTEIKKNRQINLLEDPVAPTLKSMTIPMIYGMILLMTFNLVDTFFAFLSLRFHRISSAFQSFLLFRYPA